MKTKILLFGLFFATSVIAFCSMTPEEKQGLRNITEWAIEQQAQLTTAQTNLVALGKENASLTLANSQLQQNLFEKTKQASENARERDVTLIAFGIFVALYLGTIFAGEIMRDFPTPWNLIATILCYLTVGLTAYGLGRVCLASLARLIP